MIRSHWGASHKIKEQQLKIDKARLNLEETKELMELEVQQTCNEWNESWYQIKLAEKTSEQARENLRVTDDNYHSGLVSVSELLEAQAILQQADSGLTASRCNYRIKKAKYLQAIGQLY
jgi:outer membrane protein